MNCIDQRTIQLKSPQMINRGDFIDVVYPTVKVPCGKCIPCLVNKRSDWIFRLEQEHKASQSALFVTLTYDEKHCPDELKKEHVQKFLKRLRKHDGTNKIRYYAVGEYGSRSGRPHYHLLLFNANEPDVRKSWLDKKGRMVGLVHIGRVTAASVAYCTKYVIQPELTPDGKQKPFSLMSRAYGIGAKYLTAEMIAWHREDDRNYTMRYGVKGRLPRFYREKIWYRGLNKITGKEYVHENRERVSENSKQLVLKNLAKEVEYYKKKHPENWNRVMADSRNAVIQRVKKKVAYTQTI